MNEFLSEPWKEIYASRPRANPHVTDVVFIKTVDRIVTNAAFIRQVIPVPGKGRRRVIKYTDPPILRTHPQPAVIPFGKRQDIVMTHAVVILRVMPEIYKVVVLPVEERYASALRSNPGIATAIVVDAF